jgi:uncharacterized C2H2 Zn-finger protein
METSVNISTDEYVCNICNKIYKNKSGIWKHNNKYHTIQDTNSNPKVTIQIKNSNPEVTIKSSKSNDTVLSCKYCSKVFKYKQGKWRHEQKCKNIKNNQNSKDEIINVLKQTIDEQKKLFEKQIIEMKNQLIETMNKNCKVHPKTLQKINKQLNGDHNTINENNNINKGTINNTYNIIALGHENLTDVFSKKEKMNILKYRFNSLPQLVEYAHFNDKYPQFKNILITNTQNNLAYKYDTKKKQFVAVNKDELLEDIVDERMCDINSFYEELEEELDTKTKEILDKVKDKIENEPAYKLLKKQDIKLIIYNNRKKVSKEVTDKLEIEV